jgi:single-strand DNA-binding protein
VTGRIQRQSGVCHVVAERVEDVSDALLDDLVRLHEPARFADGP